MKTFELIAKTLFGLEEVLAGELRQLGAQKIEPLNRAVKFQGDDRLMYKANLKLRTAIKILKPIANFEVYNQQHLYEQIKSLNWRQYFSQEQTFAIDATTSSDIFTHSKYLALKTKDAIVDQFRERVGTRPSVDTDFPDLRLNVHLYKNNCTVSLDSSGAPLYRRGYRLRQGQAPISEVLAAGIIALSGWNGETDFLDPMAGSGTFAIEAALMAANIAPGIKRRFTFEKWESFNPQLWQELKTEATEQIKSVGIKIFSSDKDRRTLNMARENAEMAGVEDLIHIKGGNFFSSSNPMGEGTIIINPPYDERIRQNEVMEFYKSIGDQLKKEYTGCDAWIISSHLQAIKLLGLKPSKKIKLYNGPLECRLHHYELYRGSKRG